MDVFKISVSPEVASLKDGQAGTRRRAGLAFSVHPTLVVNPPLVVLDDAMLRCSKLTVKEAKAAEEGSIQSASRDAYTFAELGFNLGLLEQADFPKLQKVAAALGVKAKGKADELRTLLADTARGATVEGVRRAGAELSKG